MRQFKYFRQIFACLPGLAAAAVLLFPFSAARSQDDRLSAKQEERSTPAVDALKEALGTSVLDPQNKDELETRRKTLQDRVNDLKGVRDLRLALMLREWRDEGVRDFRELAASLDRALALGGAFEFVPLSSEEAVPLLDRSIHKQVEARLTRIVLDGLKSRDPARQIASATLLAEMDAQVPGTRSRRGFASTFAPELAKLLKNDNPAVVEAAAQALGRINPDPAVAGPALARVLKSGRIGEKRAAAAALVAQIQDINRLKPVVNPLSFETTGKKEATDEDRLRVAQSVTQAAGQGLQDGDAMVRRICADAVERAGATLVDIIPYGGGASEIAGPELSGLARVLADQAPPLAADLRNPDAETRLMAAQALTEMARALARATREGTAAPAPSAAKEKAGYARGSGLTESLRNGLRAALPALTADLSDPDVRVRLAAVTVLDLMGQEAATAARVLAKALRDPDLFVRWAAARALGNIDSADGKVAVPNLGRLLFDPDLDPRLAAAATLEHYGKDAVDAVPDLTRAIGVGDAEIRVAVIHALEAIGSDAKSAIPALARALVDDPDDRIRQAAAEALGSLGPLAHSAEPALRRALDDPENTVRKAASSALLNLKKE